MFLITDYRLNGPDDFDQVGVYFQVFYQGDKIIKYCTITCVPMNAVGDIVACDRFGNVEMQCRVTGPIVAGTYEWNFDGWYNSDIADLQDVRVDLQYMDGTTERIPLEKLEEDLQSFAEQQQREQEEQERQRKNEEELIKREHPIMSRLRSPLINTLLGERFRREHPVISPVTSCLVYTIVTLGFLAIVLAVIGLLVGVLLAAFSD